MASDEAPSISEQEDFQKLMGFELSEPVVSSSDSAEVDEAELHKLNKNYKEVESALPEEQRGVGNRRWLQWLRGRIGMMVSKNINPDPLLQSIADEYGDPLLEKIFDADGFALNISGHLRRFYTQDDQPAFLYECFFRHNKRFNIPFKWQNVTELPQDVAANLQLTPRFGLIAEKETLMEAGKISGFLRKTRDIEKIEEIVKKGVDDIGPIFMKTVLGSASMDRGSFHKMSDYVHVKSKEKLIQVEYSGDHAPPAISPNTAFIEVHKRMGDANARLRSESSEVGGVNAAKGDAKTEKFKNDAIKSRDRNYRRRQGSKDRVVNKNERKGDSRRRRSRSTKRSRSPVKRSRTPKRSRSRSPNRNRRRRRSKSRDPAADEAWRQRMVEEQEQRRRSRAMEEFKKNSEKPVVFDYRQQKDKDDAERSKTSAELMPAPANLEPLFKQDEIPALPLPQQLDVEDQFTVGGADEGYVRLRTGGPRLVRKMAGDDRVGIEDRILALVEDVTRRHFKDRVGSRPCGKLGAGFQTAQGTSSHDVLMIRDHCHGGDAQLTGYGRYLTLLDFPSRDHQHLPTEWAPPPRDPETLRAPSVLDVKEKGLLPVGQTGAYGEPAYVSAQYLEQQQALAQRYDAPRPRLPYGPHGPSQGPPFRPRMPQQARFRGPGPSYGQPLGQMPGQGSQFETQEQAQMAANFMDYGQSNGTPVFQQNQMTRGRGQGFRPMAPMRDASHYNGPAGPVPVTPPRPQIRNGPPALHARGAGQRGRGRGGPRQTAPQRPAPPPPPEDNFMVYDEADLNSGPVNTSAPPPVSKAKDDITAYGDAFDASAVPAKSQPPLTKPPVVTTAVKTETQPAPSLGQGQQQQPLVTKGASDFKFGQSAPNVAQGQQPAVKVEGNDFHFDYSAPFDQQIDRKPVVTVPAKPANGLSPAGYSVPSTQSRYAAPFTRAPAPAAHGGPQQAYPTYQQPSGEGTQPRYDTPLTRAPTPVARGGPQQAYPTFQQPSGGDTQPRYDAPLTRAPTPAGPVARGGPQQAYQHPGGDQRFRAPGFVGGYRQMAPGQPPSQPVGLGPPIQPVGIGQPPASVPDPIAGFRPMARQPVPPQGNQFPLFQNNQPPLPRPNAPGPPLPGPSAPGSSAVAPPPPPPVKQEEYASCFAPKAPPQTSPAPPPLPPDVKISQPAQQPPPPPSGPVFPPLASGYGPQAVSDFSTYTTVSNFSSYTNYGSQGHYAQAGSNFRPPPRQPAPNYTPQHGYAPQSNYMQSAKLPSIVSAASDFVASASYRPRASGQFGSYAQQTQFSAPPRNVFNNRNT